MLANTVSAQLDKQQNGHNLVAAQQKVDQNLRTYAENASKLKVSDFNETQDKAFDILGDDFAQLIAQELPEDAPTLMYWLGKNPGEAVGYRDRYLSNPGGTTFALGKLAGKLTIQRKRTSAAAPESTVESGSVGGLDTNWQKQLDKLSDEAEFGNISKTLNAKRAIKKQAKAAGFDVSTLK